MDTTSWSAKELNKLETIQNKVGKLEFGTDKMVVTQAIRGDMGWSTFEERLYKGNQREIWLEKVDRNGWVKIFHLNSGTKSNWNRNCSRITSISGFFKIWVNSVNGSVWEWVLSLLLGEENVYDERKWKGIIRNKVKEHGLIKYKQGMCKNN